MIALYTLAAVLLLIALLLAAPVGLKVEYRDRFQGELRYLFLRFPLRPPENEEPQPEAQEPGEKEASASAQGLGRNLKAMLRREGLRGFLQSLQEMAAALKDASLALLRKLHLKRFDLYICLGGEEDAAQAAILYGQVSGAVYTACGTLFSLLDCRRKTVSVDLDYRSREHQVVFSAALSIRLLFLLKEGIILLYKALPFIRKLQPRENQRERISQTRKQGEAK